MVNPWPGQATGPAIRVTVATWDVPEASVQVIWTWSPGEYVVTAKDFAFGPDTVELEAGETVTVKNDDGAAHTWTADDGGFDEQLPAGGEVTHTFDEAGTFSYHCEIHPSMTGTITVS